MRLTLVSFLVNSGCVQAFSSFHFPVFQSAQSARLPISVQGFSKFILGCKTGNNIILGIMFGIRQRAQCVQKFCILFKRALISQRFSWKNFIYRYSITCVILERRLFCTAMQRAASCIIAYRRKNENRFTLCVRKQTYIYELYQFRVYTWLNSSF